MASAGFFSDNLGRAFPFVRGTVAAPVTGPLTLANLPNDIIADAGFVTGPMAAYDSVTAAAYLAAIRRTGDTFVFEFRSTAPNLYGVTIFFIRALLDADFALEFSDSGQIGLSESSESGEADCAEPLWCGYLVTGKLAALALLLPGDGTITGSSADAVVEPAAIQNLGGAYVTRIGLANDDRTRVTAPDGCDPVVFAADTGGIFVANDCLVGVLPFTPGYNATLRSNASDNSITLGAAVGAGAGEPCHEVPLFPSEIPPGVSTTLEGALRCNETLRSLNGIGGPMFDLLGGNGVTVLADPVTHTITVSFDMSGLTACEQVSQVSESC